MTGTMDVDDDMVEIHDEVEWELSALHAEMDGGIDNIDHLHCLIKEITIIIRHKVELTHGWYDERIIDVRLYRNLDWEDLIQKCIGSNAFMYTTTMQLLSRMNALLEEYEATGQFSLDHYQYVMYNVNNIWTFYKANYVSNMDELVANFTEL